MNKKGKLIVIEGADGSGKSTQLNLLLEYFKKENINVNTLKFPQHGHGIFGKMVDRFLLGEFGKLDQVNPYLASVLYAMDRATAKKQMDAWLEKGEYIVLDRYVPSNIGHQCSRLPKRQRNNFFKWDMELEYEYNQLPKEDIILYLHVPYIISLKLLRNKNRTGREYMKGKLRDINEADRHHLQKAEETYKWLQKKLPHFVKITCVDRKGNLKSREAIHEDVIMVLKKKNIIEGLGVRG